MLKAGRRTWGSNSLSRQDGERGARGGGGMETGCSKDEAAHETNLKTPGLCGDAERRQTKRPPPWVSQQLVEKQAF